MRLNPRVIGLAVLSAVCMGFDAHAEIFSINTYSTATQNIDSALGDFTLTATGVQHFTIDTTAGTADVTSPFKGSDFPDPYSGGHDTYNLYNTITTGTVTTVSPGVYDIAFHLLFELDVTSGPLNGLSLVTHDNATFETMGATLPFLPGTSFSDLGGSDSVGIYVKDDFGPFTAGTLVGSSLDRVVTINSIVPEPSSLVSGSLATLIGIAVAWRRSRGNRVRQQA